jgi:hypothetical protein
MAGILRTALLLATVIGASDARAIAINDVGTPGHVTGNAAYTGVVQVVFREVGTSNYFLCSGVLVGATQVLTAGHCVDNSTDFAIRFETGSGTSTRGAASAVVHPMFASRPAPVSQIEQYDLAMITLDAAAPGDAEIYGLKLDLAGVTTSSLIDIVGYGIGGNPTVGFLPSGTRRHAVNSFDAYLTSLSGAPTPDNPLLMSHEFGAGVPPGTATLGLPNGGDSGSPALFNGLVIGISSAGDLPRPPDAFEPDLYYAIYASLFPVAVSEWVQAQLNAVVTASGDPNPAAVPAPSSILCFAVGLVALMHRRPRST